MKVNINRVLDILSELKEINETKLNDIEWVKDGEVIPITQEMIDKYKFIGLNNVCFITHEFYIDKE